MSLMPCPIEGCNAMIANQPNWHCPQCGGSKFGVEEQAAMERRGRLRQDREERKAAEKSAEQAEKLKAWQEWENKTFFQKAPLRLFYGFCWLLFMVMLLGLWEACSKLWD